MLKKNLETIYKNLNTTNIQITKIEIPNGILNKTIQLSDAKKLIKEAKYLLIKIQIRKKILE